MAPDRGDTLTMLGTIAAVVVCCALPLLLIGGIGLIAGIAWGKVLLVLLGLTAVGVAVGQAATRTLRRHRGE